MRIYNAKVYTDGKFIDGGIDFDKKINAVGSEITDGDIDAEGSYIIPGLIDIHTHAAVGEDASDGKPEGIPKMARHYASQGVTSWCPTTMTLKEPTLIKAVEAIKSYKRVKDGAKVAGVNLEGPFVCYAKRGAQNADNLHKPDYEMFCRINEASGGIVRLITVAPEEEGAIEFIEKASKVCAVSVGHTTADYDTAMRAFAAGASHATHLFNAMPALHHRDPGVIAAARDSGATVELISDGLHIHPAVVRLTSALFGDKLCLISDSLRCTYMPDGEYEFGGQTITLKNGKACMTGTDTLAGSTIHLIDGVKRAVKFGVPLEKAVYAATLAPAKVIKADDTIGSLSKGKCADLVILDKDLNARDVYIDGQSIGS